MGDVWPDDLLRKRKVTYTDYFKGKANAHGEGSRMKEIYDYIVVNMISNPEIRLLVQTERSRLDELKNAKETAYRATAVTKDNQGVYVGSGGSNKNKVRYPRKSRSLRTWKKFYEMFPWRAELDGWDGKTSSRMKKS